jgi:hypothetical protein
MSQTIERYQNIHAIALALSAFAVVGFQTAFLVINMLLFMELIQMETTFYILLYVPIYTGLVLIWTGLHHSFVRGYKPEESTDKDNKVTFAELSKARSLQIANIMYLVILLCASLIFLARFPGSIAPGDGHIVQNGMDTKSALYSIWMVILCIVILGASYTMTHAVYLFDLYMNRFRKALKLKR